MKEAALKWFKQAKHDLEMAEKNIDIGGYDVASFLSHQAVEKLLKAIIILEGKKPKKSHYLDEMARELGLTDDFFDDLAELSADYMISRYPDISGGVPYEEYDIETAKEKVAVAKKIFDKLKNRLVIGNE
jgi:HEPN domain-containing protein